MVTMSENWRGRASLTDLTLDGVYLPTLSLNKRGVESFCVICCIAA